MNLLKNYNLTLAKVHQLGYEVAEQYETVEFKPVTPSWTSKFIRTFAIATFSFALIAAILLLVINPFKKTPPAINTDPVETVAPLPILAPVEGYVQIQVFEFDDMASPPADVTRNITPDIEALPVIVSAEIPTEASMQQVVAVPVQQGTQTATSAQPSANTAQNRQTSAPQAQQSQATAPAGQPAPIQQTTTAPAQTNQTPSTPSTPQAAQYSVVISEITPEEFDTLQKLAQQFNSNALVISEKVELQTDWVVYLPETGSGIVIEGMEVAPAVHFSTKQEAVQYAELNNTDAVIRSEPNVKRLFETQICCMDLEQAKNYAQHTGIFDRLLRIQREQ